MQRTTTSPTIGFVEDRLDNGLRLVLAEDHLAPVVAVNLWYDVGSKHERPGRTGLAHLFEHMMFQGSANVAKGEHFRFIQRAGGGLNASTSIERTNYFESGPSNQLELYLWLEADRMGGLLDALGQETLDNQRDVVKNERRQSVDNPPYGTAFIRLQEMLFPEGHPYHHPIIGSMEDLTAASLDDVREFFRTYYAPNNAVLSIVGDFDPVQARAWVDRYFGAIPSSASLPPPPDASLEPGTDGEARAVVPDRVPLPRVYLGFRSPPVGTRENDAMTMASASLSLGDSKSTRLYRRLVRERQVAQEAEFFTFELQGVSLSGGYATARAGVATDELEAALLETIGTLADDPPGDEELSRVRAGFEREMISRYFIRASSRADWLSEHATVWGDPAKANERLPAFLSVTSDEIAEVARTVFRPDNRIVLTFVPQETR